jgi:ABC-2 type transport system permease protein
MRTVTAIIRRELIAYFSSPLAYIVLATFLLLQGFIFWLIISFLNDPSAPPMQPLQAFMGGTIFFWLFLLFIVAVITMRLISEELRSGTIELLLTAPVTEGQVVTGKFVAALLFYLILWAPTLLYVAILAQLTAVDMGPVASFFVGITCLGVLFIGVGMFFSTLTRNQIIAAILAFAAFIFLFSAGLLEQLFTVNQAASSVFGHMNLWTHMDDYAMGIVDTRHVIYELSVGLAFVFLAARSLEVRKWR